jgi:hypothetical protein
MPETPPYIDQVKRLSAELDRRIAEHRRTEPYLVGEAPLPTAVQQARLTKVYRYLMPVAEAPWGSLVVDSKLDRLEVSGITDRDSGVAKRIWEEAWQANSMDAESKLGHGAALLDGRFYATVWADEQGRPDIALDDVTQMVVEFLDGSRRRRTGALRRWKEAGRVYATLYRPDGIFKYQGPSDSARPRPGRWSGRSGPSTARTGRSRTPSASSRWSRSASIRAWRPATSRTRAASSRTAPA